MTHKLHAVDASAPLKAVRRFDVFAEVNRLEALAEGRPDDEAKGYGVWLAKVVAGRRYGAKSDGGGREAGKSGERDKSSARSADARFKSAGGEVQTDKTFDEEIVDRMGRGFYERVFSPAIREAVSAGRTYEEIRDTIRADWKPQR